MCEKNINEHPISNSYPTKKYEEMSEKEKDDYFCNKSFKITKFSAKVGFDLYYAEFGFPDEE